MEEFIQFHDEIPGLNSKSISCDFEQAAISVIEESYLGVTFEGCFFPFSTYCNVQKQLKQIGLQDLCNSNPDFALSAKMITALCFVRVFHLDTYIDILSDNLPLELHSLLN